MKHDAEGHPFEKGLERLETISAKLDAEETPLEDAIRLYEEGLKLSASLSEYLSQAERRILVAPKTAGEPLTIGTCQPLDSDAAPAKKATRTRRAPSQAEDSLF